MKKLIYMFLLLLPLLQACSDNEIGGETDDSEKVEVSIQTQVETKTTVVTSLGDGDEMNVYAKAMDRWMPLIWFRTFALQIRMESGA